MSAFAGGNPAALVQGESVKENTLKSLSLRQFEKYDKDGNGSLDLLELKAFLIDQGIFLSKVGLELAMKELDRDGNKKITYDEFSAWKKLSSWEALSFDESKLQARVRAAQTFDAHDKDGDGHLDRSEFKVFYDDMSSYGLLTGTLDEALAKLDSDGSGTIEYLEFCQWLDTAF